VTTNPQYREQTIATLSRPAQAVYRRLKCQHIDGLAPEEKTTTVDELAGTISGSVEGQVDELVEKGLAVQRGDTVMWMPMVSLELYRTLEAVKSGTTVPPATHEAADCLVAMGLVTRDGPGYCYHWTD
jgi:acetyl/propionyl-CoA carboxylase alpha subunit